MNGSPPPFDPSKPFTTESAGPPPPFDPAKSYKLDGKTVNPRPSFGEAVLRAGEKTLSEAGFRFPWHVETAEEYPREGKDVLSNVIHAGKRAVGDTMSSLGLILGPGETALNAASRAIPPLISEGEQAALKLKNQARGAISSAFARGVKAGAPTAADALVEFKKAKAEGQPLSLVDIQNAPLGELAGTTYRQGGAARETIKGALDTRKAASLARTEEIIGRHLSDESMRGTAATLAEARAAKAKPLWDAVRKSGPIWSDRLKELLDQPEVQRGIRHGFAIERRRAIGSNEPFNPHDYAVTSFDAAGDPVFGKIPTMAQMMVAKEGLDAIIESPGMKDPLTGRPTKDGLSYMKLRDGLVTELDRLSPLYRQAREVWSGDTASIRALNLGRDFLSSKVSPEELAEHVGKMSDSDRQFYVVGVADALKNRLFRAADAGNKGNIINTEDARMRLRSLFGNDAAADAAAQKFIDAIERERAMGRTGSRIYGGSPTAERVSDDQAAEVALRAAHGITRILEGRFLGAAMQAFRVYRMFGGKPNPALSEAIAKALVDPNIGISDVGDLLPQTPVPKTKAPIAPPALLFGSVPWMPTP